jgi:hypothetical protein
MDLSKLPKLSGNREADKPQESIPQNAASGTEKPAGIGPVPIPYQPRAIEPPAPGPDAFLSLAIGAVLMMVGRGFAEWVIATICGKAYDTGYTWGGGPKDGQIIPYWEVERCAALSESTVFLFGLILVIGGLATIAARMVPRGWRPLLFGVWLLTLLVTAYNAVAIAILLHNDIMPTMATLLTGLGTYEAWIQWRLLQYGARGM